MCRRVALRGITVQLHVGHVQTRAPSVLLSLKTLAIATPCSSKYSSFFFIFITLNQRSKHPPGQLGTPSRGHTQVARIIRRCPLGTSYGRGISQTGRGRTPHESKGGTTSNKGSSRRKIYNEETKGLHTEVYQTQLYDLRRNTLRRTNGK